MQSRVKIRAPDTLGYRTMAVRSALNACRSRGREMSSCTPIQHGAFMHHVIVWSVAVAAAAVFAGCSDIAAPDPRDAGDATSFVELARQAKQPRVPAPDSVGIPPMPIPPIYEELPPILDGDG